MIAKKIRNSSAIVNYLLKIAAAILVVTGGIGSFITPPIIQRSGFGMQLPLPNFIHLGWLNDTTIERLISCFTILLIALILWLISDIFANIQKGISPFSRSQVDTFATIAKLMMAYTIIPSVLDYMLHQLSSTPYISFYLSWSSLIFTLTIYALSQIFKYGAELQQEVDETL